MRYYALAADYDGTLALHGKVGDDTLEALVRLRDSGRHLILVTGRELEELLDVFPRIDLFSRVVVENGGVLYRPEDGDIVSLTTPPPEEFVTQLRERGVAPLSVGRTIIATWRPHETEVLRAIVDMGLELQIIFNKDAVMVLPTGVNKATGLRAALRDMRLSPHNVVGIGDGENDHAFLGICEFSVAVANAVPFLREQADLVTAGESGEGVTELIDRMVETDLKDLESRLTRHEIPLGVTGDDREVRIPPYGKNILFAGSSGAGKSTLSIAFLEQLAERGYQFCIIDPEGDYQELRSATPLDLSGGQTRAGEIFALLDDPAVNCSVNMSGVPFEDRAPYSREILSHVLEIRTRSGHPHWIVADEAHHLFPNAFRPDTFMFPETTRGIVFITVHPIHVLSAVLRIVDILLITGEAPEAAIREFCGVVGCTPPETPAVNLAKGEALIWKIGSGEPPVPFRSIIPREEHGRHRVKYAKGELEPEESFYFRGPEGKLNLRANNLLLFVQIAEGVDDETWMYHLRRNDYSRWFCNVIHDDTLAGAAEEIERNPALSPDESRRLVLEKIRERYAAPV